MLWGADSCLTCCACCGHSGRFTCACQSARAAARPWRQSSWPPGQEVREGGQAVVSQHPAGGVMQRACSALSLGSWARVEARQVGRLWCGSFGGLLHQQAAQGAGRQAGKLSAGHASCPTSQPAPSRQCQRAVPAGRAPKRPLKGSHLLALLVQQEGGRHLDAQLRQGKGRGEGQALSTTAVNTALYR